MLFGLQSLGDSDEMRGLLLALTPLLVRSDEPLDRQAIGEALYGLQSLGDSPEVLFFFFFFSVAFVQQSQPIAEYIA